MLLSEMENAIKEAEAVQARADLCAKKMAKLLVGRLRAVSRGRYYSDIDVLRNLKRELQGFNAVTGEWK